MLARLFLCVALMACSKDFTPPPKVVEVEVVQFHRFLMTTRLIGYVKAKNEAILTAKTSGTVDFKALSGDNIKKGEVIAEIDSKDLEQSAELSKQAYELAEKKYERAVSLSQNKTVSVQDLGDRKTEMIRAQREYYAAKRQLEQSQFIAPFDGILGVFQVREGAHMNTGDTLAAFYQPEKLMITFDIPEDLVSYVKQGQKVFVNGKQFTLNGYQPVIDPETHMALASFDYRCETCIIGSNIDIDLTLVDKEKAISIPLEALFYKGKQPFVYVIKEGKAIPQKITLGERSDGRFEVVEGLHEGDQVISKNISRLWPTAAVMVQEEEKESAEKNTASEKEEKAANAPKEKA